MNKYVIHTTTGKFPHYKNIYLVEVKPEAEGFKKLDRRPHAPMLVLKKWTGYVGKKETSRGNIGLRQAIELKEALEKGQFESARALYHAGVFEHPHATILSILSH